jgi:hypothetical protein
VREGEKGEKERREYVRVKGENEEGGKWEK